MNLERCRIVLIRPEVAGNLGATARIMRNMGLRDLVLVAPVADPESREARQRSTHGESILDSARIVPTFEEAVADCGLVVGTSGEVGGPVRRQSVGTPDLVAPHLAAALAHGPAALVFGPEPCGLNNAELTRCQHVIHIPTDAAYASLNLSHAVAICCYELRRVCLRLAGPDSESVPPLAGFADQERVFERLRQALESIHFIYGEKGEPLWHAVRHLLGRAQLSPMEVKLLHGLARQLEWYVANHPPISDR